MDKTGLIEYTNEVLDTEQRYICNSRPRRFGKSMAAGMLAAYYVKGYDSRELFEGLKIAGQPSFEEHLNQYDVIHLDMAYLLVQNQSAADTVAFMQACVIDELKDIYPGVLTDKDQALPFALSKINNGYNSESALNNFREFTMLNPKGLSGKAAVSRDQLRQGW